MKLGLLAMLIAAALPVMAQQLADGEVRKVDKAANKVTLKHGPVPSIDMPAMTMVFRAKDPAMLAGLKPGDKVKFEAQKVGDVYTVTRIEPAK
jgi:Cu(I)/Ag(I) efflux system periplasmic protein CusF